ncbi:YdcH family protein [Campylobacter sp. 19-13652]|uniref:YdcH family protein n=1 Tax=Campylobacter sp. 19-13652 TaxID=2840180 RepID=UPI001C76E81C|nr:DUF465 domain-containing protein [Campylobacter sp. 19-13652]BCX79567.1 hypothetical protein LBC_10290 [Campylobacter sp. 19-13652]
MLHEYREEIKALKNENNHFAALWEKHNSLDDAIENGAALSDMELEKLKKEKLLVKDEIYSMILKYKKEHEA